MKKVLLLAKSDLLLDPLYLFINIALSVGIPFFVFHSMEEYNLKSLDFIALFLSMVYCCFMLLGKTGMIDVKYKEKTFWTLTEASRKHVVIAKYIFWLAVQCFCLLGYEVSSVVFPIVSPLSFKTIGWSFLISASLFGIYLPLEYIIGYENVKYYLMLLVVGSPLLIGSLAKNSSFGWISSFISRLNSLTLFALPAAVCIVLVSGFVSIRIYENKDL